jgi:parallel beta-helix repeat protein
MGHCGNLVGKARTTRVFSVSIGALFLLIAGGGSARAACPPCSLSYTLSVEYHLGGSAQSTILSNSAFVSDIDLDRDLGLVQGLLQAQVSSTAILDRVKSVTLGSVAGAEASDVLLARDGDVVLWVEAADSPAARLHASTRTSLDAQHAFAYTVTAQGSESPPVTFSFLMAALGNESYPKPAHHEEAIGIAHYDPDARECRSISGDVCLPVDCTKASRRLADSSVGGLLSRTLTDNGDRCAHYEVRVSSTNFFGFDCDGNYKACEWCGAWYQGTVVLDGTCLARRSWSRKAIGTGTVTGPAGDKPRIDFLISYTQAGGALGSGLPDGGGLFGSTSYAAQIQDCETSGVAVSCNSVHFGMQDDTLHASTDYSRPVQSVFQGTGSLSAPQGIVFFGTFPFDAPNRDERYLLTVTFAGKNYTDLNDDGTVDIGPFSLWLGGKNGDELWGAFDRSSVPTAVIDSIAPSPALAGQAVHFAGHGTGGTISGYEWRTHRLTEVLSNSSSFSREDIVSGKHQIKFRVFGQNASAYVFATLTVNQPPVAFINHIENAVDPAHPAVSLLLRDGIPSDPFRFDGGGLDFDGSVVAYEWTSDLQGILKTAPRFDASLVLGTHKISLRVRDDQGVWSAPVATTVTVRRPPVLLVHGICGSSDTWSELTSNYYLGPEWQGSDVYRRTFDPNRNGKTNDSPMDIAALVAAEIQDMKTRFGVRTVNVVVHSMGGLATRSYIQGPGFQGDVNKLVMLGTPNHGANIADLLLIGQSYSQQEVGLFIPIPGIIEILRAIGLIVNTNLFNLGTFIECQAEDSPALHALRPHSNFIRNLNRTFKDEGTEDFGPSGEPEDRIAPSTDYFLINGRGVAASHFHLPVRVKDLIFAATAGLVDLAHMEVAWVRAGDLAVSYRSVSLDHVAQTEFDHSHGELPRSEDSVGKARDYLLDDPPPPPPAQPGLDEIAGAQLLGAARGSSLPSSQQDIRVDGAAVRLQVNLSWEAADARPGLDLLLTSPSGVTYDSSSPAPGFDVVHDGASLTGTIASPTPGTWKVQVVGGLGAAFAYRWLAHQESGTFLAIGLSTHRTDPGKPVKLAAYVQSEGEGVTGATVHAAVAPPAGKPVSLPMIEDSRFPGLYVTDFMPQAEGIYNVLAAASVPVPNGGAPVTRSGITNFDARFLTELSIQASLSNPEPQHGEPVRWLATVRNAGAAGAPATVVQFFDGLPAEDGRLLGTRTIDLPPGPSEAQTSILWLATAGAHRLVAVVDPMNRAGEADLTRHVAEIQATVIDRTPPIARAGADQVAAVRQNVVFDGRASTDDDRIESYVWRYPVANGASAGTKRLPFSFFLQGPYVALPGGFPGPGTYTVQLTVADTYGNVVSDLITVRVIEDFDTTAPIADAGLEMGAVAGAPVIFDGTRSRDDFGIARATWDIDITTDSDGDGDPANDQDLAGLSPTLAPGYPQPGLYRTRLTVSDAAGNGPSTSNVLVRVGQPASDCTVTVPRGSDVNRALALASPGETVCLRPGLYQTGITVASPGVTLDGQGAVLDRPSLGDFGIGVTLATPEDGAELRGVTVRHLTVRGCFVGFFLASGLGHHLMDNTVQDCQVGFAVSVSKSLLERNRVESSGYGFLVHGAGNRLVDNSARGGSVGIEVHGFRQRLEGNQACSNLSDLVGRSSGLASGADNACGVALSWSDEGRSGCTYRCNQIRLPSSGLVVDQDTYFDAGSFLLTSGIVVTGSPVRVRFAGTELVGPKGVDVPGVEIRDAPDASLSGGTIVGFNRGLQVEHSDGVRISGLEIRDAEVGIDVASSAQGQLSGVRVAAERLALRLAASTRGWTVGQSEFAGEEESGALLAGIGHSLRHNQIAGGVILTETAGSRLIDNVITSRREGISLISSDTTEIRSNEVRGNAAGILVRDSSAARITGNIVSGHRGILLDGGAGHRVAGNRVEAIATAIHLSGGRSGRILENTLTARQGPAILLNLTEGNEIARNDATSSLEGIDLHSSDANRIHGNRCVPSGLLPGITLAGSKGNDISNNVLTDLWPGGVLALASNDNRMAGNKLRASGAAPREIVTLGIGLIEKLQDAPGIPPGDLARGLALSWESLRPFAGLERITFGTGAGFFDRLGAALRIFHKLAAAPRTLPEERSLLQLAAAQMVRGAELAVRRAIRDARAAGLDDLTLQRAQRLLQQGVRLAASGRTDLAVDSFSQAWATVGAAASSPARLAATLTVTGRLTEGREVSYTALLTNAGPRTQRDNPGDEFFIRLPVELDLVDVVASAGQGTADRAMRTIAWNGAIPPGTSVRLTIRAIIRSGTVGKTVISQGTVQFDVHGNGLNEALAPTDDPVPPGPADATTFVVASGGASPVEIPTLSTAALLLLASLFAASALTALRRKPS